MKSKKCFIISKMFVGSYLEQNDSKNIGHEILNLFSSDDSNKTGGNYIYIYRGEKSLPARKGNIEAVIMTERFGKGCQEIIGVATVEDVLLLRFHDNQSGHSGIQYSGHDIEDIFDENYSSKGEKETPHYISYIKTKQFYWPRKRIFLADQCSDYDKDYEDDKTLIKKLPRYTFGRESLKLFIEEDSPTYEAICELIQEKKYFRQEKPATINLKDIEKRERNECYLRAMDKMNDESIISNLLRYFLSLDRPLLQAFCKKLFNISIDEETVKIEREHSLSNRGRVDIWIEDKDHLIVIENKIKSGLNGQGGNQLKGYIKAVNGKKEYKAKNPVFYIFVPNQGYSPQLDIHLDQEGKIDGFTKIDYKKIRDILSSKPILVEDESEQFNNKIRTYYEDFLLALGLHCGEKDLSAKRMMEQLLYKKLRKLERRR